MHELLLVEDDPEIISILTQVFENIGFKVYSTDRMDIGLEILRKHLIKIIITDFHIQQGSGRRLLNEARKIKPYVPVFLITGTPFVDQKDFAIYRFDGVFLKPFAMDAIVAEVKKACDLE